MDLIKTHFIESVFAGGREMGALADSRRRTDAPRMRIEPEKETDR